MSRNKENIGRKPFKKTDVEYLVLKEGFISTLKQKDQIYKIRIARWGKFQPVIEKRLYRYDFDLMEYVPGRLMAFNLEDMQVINDNNEKIMALMKDLYKDFEADMVEIERIESNLSITPPCPGKIFP